MDIGKESDRWRRWDHVPQADGGGAMRTRGHAREATAAKRTRHWHHAKWIAINVVLIAFTGWLYAEYLIPRFIVGDTAATRVAPDTWIADRPQVLPTASRVEPADQRSPAASTHQGSTHVAQERRRPRPERNRAREYLDAESLRIIDAECIAGTVVRKRVVDGVPEIANIPGTYCR